MLYNNIMNKHGEKARRLFRQGFSCSQAVIGAYAEDLGLDTEMMLKLASSFGGGMGRLREVCGTVSAMFMIAGLLKGYSNPTDSELKKAHYTLIQDLASKFKAKNESIVCRDLLHLLATEKISPIPTPRTEEYYKERPCAKFVVDACDIIDAELLSAIEV